MKVYSLFLLILMSCGGDESSEESAVHDTPETTEEVAETQPEVGTIEVGGIPNLETAGELQALSDADAGTAAKSINAVTGQLALDLSDDSGSALTLSDDCQDGIYCLAKTFEDIYDMVSDGAKCNFDLLLFDENGQPKTLNRVKDHPVFYVDGFGTIGIGNEGKAVCPSHKTVTNWAKHKGLIEGEPEGKDSDEEIYPPSRLVIYKGKEGKFRWVVIFFPKDSIARLAEKVSFFQQFLEQDLDFKAYTGSHEGQGELGNGKGSMVLDWNELHRLSHALSGASLADDGMPEGKIVVNYDTLGDTKEFRTTFKDGFSFGDDSDSPFTVDTETVIMRRGDENYLHFQSGKPLVSPDDANDPGPLGIVRLCVNDPASGGDPISDVAVNKVPKASRLQTKSNTHVQILWKSIASGKKQPDDYISVLTATKGGPYIYGSSEFQMATKAGKGGSAIRIKAPWCPEATDAILTAWKNVSAANGGPYVFRGIDGYRNMTFPGKIGSSSSGTPKFVTKASIEGNFPTFTYFKPIDVEDQAATPMIP